MKHNEVKAYFKKKLKENITNYDILSIDESSTYRKLFILNPNTLTVKVMINCFFGAKEFHIRAFENKNTKINIYTDAYDDFEGDYMQLEKLGRFIQMLKNRLEVEDEQI